MIPRSTPEAICLAKRLVDCFSGIVDYNDPDDTDIDYIAPTPELISSQDGEPYHDWQTRLMAVESITNAELAKPRPWRHIE
jgi:hypothetical protein